MTAPNLEEAQRLITEECDAIKEMLLDKNRAYGNAALAPIRIASKASPEEQILVRIDDKLNRLMQGAAAGEDVWLDLAGYIILLRVCRRMSAKKGSQTGLRKAPLVAGMVTHLPECEIINSSGMRVDPVWRCAQGCPLDNF